MTVTIGPPWRKPDLTSGQKVHGKNAKNSTGDTICRTDALDMLNGKPMALHGVTSASTTPLTVQ